MRGSRLTLLAVLFVASLAGAALARPVTGEGFDFVYPKPKSDLRFSHAAHAKMDCLKCHAGVSESARSADRNLPDEAVCAECHAKDLRKSPGEKGTPQRCGRCHADYDATGTALPKRPSYPTPVLNFSHTAHVLRMQACTGCHVGIALSEVSGGRHYPKEAQCVACHDKPGRVTDCAFCHPSLPSGRLERARAERRLAPSTGALDHRRDWLKRHAKETALQSQACKNCHADNECLRCHDGVRKPMSIHSGDYATLHPIDARKDSTRCQACHRYQSFCLDCHTKLGVSTETKATRGRSRIHPEGFGSCTLVGNHHSYQAKRDLEACVSCHREADCLRCHKSGGECPANLKIHSGLSVHGHLSRDELARIKRQNSAACVKCHGH